MKYLLIVLCGLCLVGCSQKAVVFDQYEKDNQTVREANRIKRHREALVYLGYDPTTQSPLMQDVLDNITLRLKKIEQKDNPYYSSQLYVDTATASIVTVGLDESK